MIDLESLNVKRTFNFSGAVEDYRKLDNSFKIGVVRALFINKGGKYGDSATVIITYNDGNNLHDVGVNLPKHQLTNVEKLLNDYDMIDMINNYGLSIEPTRYHSNKYEIDGYTVNWINTPNELKELVKSNDIQF